MISLDLNASGAFARRIGVAAMVLCVCTVSSHSAPVLDRTKCLNAPTQDCVFALALEESEILHLDRMFPRRNISDEKKAQWREELKDPTRKAKWEKFFRTFRGYKIVAAERAEAGLLDRALDTAQVVGSNNKKMAVWSLRDIVERLARKGNFAGIERVFALIGDESARMRAGEAIVDEAVKNGSVKLAIEFITKLEPQTERARLLQRVALGQTARGAQSDALRTAAIAETFVRGTSLPPMYRIRYLIDVGDVDAAKTAIAQNPDANSYVRSVWARAFAIHYAKEGDVEKADAYLEDVIYAKLYATATVEIPALLVPHPEHKEEAIQRANKLPDRHYRLQAIYKVASAIARRGDIAGAHRVICLLMEQKQIDTAYWAVGTMLAFNGEIDEAQRMIAKVQGDRLKRKGLMRLAEKQAAAGDIEGARRSIAGLPSESIPANVDEEIAVALARSGRVREGIEAGLNHWDFVTRIRILSRIAVGLGAN